MNRKDFLKTLTLGLSSAFALNLNSETLSEDESEDIRIPSKIKTVVLVNLIGGLSHVDGFDYKPGISSFNPVETSQKGLKISELFKKTARELHRAIIIKSIKSEDADHKNAQFLLNTGYRFSEANGFPDIPSNASVISFSRAKEKKGGSYFPTVITLGERGGMIGKSGFLGVRHSGFHVSNLENPLTFLKPGTAGITSERLFARGKILDMLNSTFNKKYSSHEYEVWNEMFEAAMEFANSDRLSLFDINSEPASRKERFGNNPIGRCFLMAKKLAEAEVPVIQISLGGFDTHSNNYKTLSDRCKEFDPALSAFLGEAGSSGLLDQTLVYIGSDFGRTPEISGNDGRDHFVSAWSVLLAGGGLKGGVIGETDQRGSSVKKGINEYHPRDISATIYKLVGVKPDGVLTNAKGRPFNLCSNNYKFISEIV